MSTHTPEYMKQYEEVNKEKLAAYRKKYYKDNKESILAKNKVRREANRDVEIARSKVYHESHKEEASKRAAEYRAENKESIALQKKIDHEKNRDRDLERSRKHYEANKEIYQLRSNQQYNADKKKHYEQGRVWIAANPEKQRESGRKYNKAYRSTPKGNITSTISKRMNESLRKGMKAGRHWETLVDFTVDQLKLHLEKLFTPEMNWGNYGTYWHIDHKLPVAMFSYEKPEDIDFRICWSIKNLQPLEAKENMSKGAKILQPLLASKVA